uniref:H(+)/Pi cotransporter n=1 Tax=Oryza glaberrima TaxID=4538 RepID=I1P7M3_ORYGL
MGRQDQQLQVLNALDAAKTQWYHFTAIIVAGMGFFTDAYDLFCISLVTKLLGRIYYTDPASPTPGSVEIEVEEEKLQDITRGRDYGLFSARFAKRHGAHLLGTAATWFLVDVAYYSQNLFQKDIFTSIHWIPKARTMSALEEVFRISRAQTLIALCGTVPGYWFTVFLIDIIGRFKIQLLGFAGMTAFMLGLAIPYHHWTMPGNQVIFVFLYGFTFFFANFGPNATAFIVPAEIFPARLRSTCHGISAASGKAGAIIGAFGFLYAAQPQDKAHVDAGYKPGIGVRNALFVLAGCNLVGFLMTWMLVPESKGKSLEEMSGEADDEEASANGGATAVNSSGVEMV